MQKNKKKKLYYFKILMSLIQKLGIIGKKTKLKTIFPKKAFCSIFLKAYEVILQIKSQKLNSESQ